MQENLSNLLPEIYEHVAEESPREACGLVVDRGNDLEYIPLENISEIENQFKIDPKTE